jgi:hypothetical protein
LVEESSEAVLVVPELLQDKTQNVLPSRKTKMIFFIIEEFFKRYDFISGKNYQKPVH